MLVFLALMFSPAMYKMNPLYNYIGSSHPQCYPCVCFTEPFPAFKSWQEDCESGEAQLSPQAARMTHHPWERTALQYYLIVVQILGKANVSYMIQKRWISRQRHFPSLEFEGHPSVQKMRKEKTEHHISWSRNFRKKSDNSRSNLKGKEIASPPTATLQPIRRY